MVNFTNVVYDSEWVYADAYDIDNDVSGKVKQGGSRTIAWG